jgi:site-specific DNA-methyltransferase (adenine-specific)
MAVNIEDAGWEIKDTLMWLYGQGFPKGADISKMIDKMQGAKPTIIGDKKVKGGWHHEHTINDDGWTGSEQHTTVPTTPDANLWYGWKSHALKPAWEPIIMAMKPNDGTYAENALKYGVAGLNIDGGRIGFVSESDRRESENKNRHADFGSGPRDNKIYGEDKVSRAEQGNYSPAGRYPANVLLDEESAKMLDEQSGVGGSSKMVSRTRDKGKSWRKMEGIEGSMGCVEAIDNYGDTGGASRFFYVAKASPDEHAGGDHPTVKPLNLVMYLCKLTKTPIGGIVLDPFLGTGTTLRACREIGRTGLGFEIDPSYEPAIRQKYMINTPSLDEYAEEEE